MTSQGTKVFKDQVVNDVIVLDYSAGEYAEYLKAKAQYEADSAAYYGSIERIETEDPPLPPEIENALEGLRIMDCTANQDSNLTRSPIETGVNISDCKVRIPNRITIKGICDNMRGGIETTKDTRSDVDIPVVGGIVNSVVDATTGYEYETKETIETIARNVFGKIQAMYLNKDRLENGRPKTWIVSTKGAVYPNMVLKSVEQLNDWEHLMVIPVTLHFEELMMTGDDEDNGVVFDASDAKLSMGGSMKKGNILEETWQSITEAF